MTLQVKLAGSHGIVGWGGVHNFNLQETTSVFIKHAACEIIFYNMLCANKVLTTCCVQWKFLQHFLYVKEVLIK